jgi:hypothetical protein
MATLTPPQSAACSTPSPNQYYSAYSGCAVYRGQFTHFIRKPDQSHLDYGFWCFATSQDEFRAFGLGYHTPEDILIAVDSGERDNFTDISLLWVPGRVDPALRSQISGNAVQHIRVIYNMRLFLRKALSFQGRAPTYPMNPKLKDYWSSRCIPASSLAEPPVVQAFTKPQSSSFQSLSLPSSVAQPTAIQQQTAPDSPQIQNGRKKNSFNSVICDTISSNTQISTQFPGMTGGTPAVPNGPTQPGPAPALAASSHLSPNIVAQAVQTNNHQPSTICTAQTRSSPAATVAQLYNDTTQVARSPGNTCHQTSFIQRNPQYQTPPTWHRPPQKNAQPPYTVQALRPQPPQPSPGQTQASNPAQKNVQSANANRIGITAGYQVQSRYGASPFGSSPYIASLGQPTSVIGGPRDDQHSPFTAVSEGIQRYSTTYAGSQAGRQFPGAVEKPHPKSPRSTMNNAASKLQQLQKSTVMIDPRLAERPRNGSTVPVSAATQVHLSLDEEEPITVAPDETVVEERIVTPPCNVPTILKKASVSRPTEPKTQQTKSLKRLAEVDSNEARENKRLKAENHRHDSLRTTPEQAPRPTLVLDTATSENVVKDMYAELPCMDCGQDMGHKQGCFLGKDSLAFAIAM